MRLGLLPLLRSRKKVSKRSMAAIDEGDMRSTGVFIRIRTCGNNL
jgi:hypothetical protein